MLPGGQDITLHTADGLALTAWYVPAPAAACSMTVLVAPGNGGNRAGRAALALGLIDHGYGVLCSSTAGTAAIPARRLNRAWRWTRWPPGISWSATGCRTAG